MLSNTNPRRHTDSGTLSDHRKPQHIEPTHREGGMNARTHGNGHHVRRRTKGPTTARGGTASTPDRPEVLPGGKLSAPEGALEGDPEGDPEGDRRISSTLRPSARLPISVLTRRPEAEDLTLPPPSLTTLLWPTESRRGTPLPDGVRSTANSPCVCGHGVWDGARGFAGGGGREGREPWGTRGLGSQPGRTT